MLRSPLTPHQERNCTDALTTNGELWTAPPLPERDAVRAPRRSHMDREPRMFKV
jgi:hypothetical protein